jgi:hypothetical protein
MMMSIARAIRTTVEVDGAVATDRWIIEGRWRTVRTVLATAGERLVLQHVKWTRGEPGADSEVEGLAMDEVDQDGRFVRAVARRLRVRDYRVIYTIDPPDVVVIVKVGHRREVYED